MQRPNRTTLIFYVIFVCLFASTSHCYDIEVTGIGTSQETAIQDGLRKAVERATGTYILSETLVNNGMLTRDKILTASNGTINKYKINNESRQDGNWFINLLVDINLSYFDNINGVGYNYKKLEDSIYDYNMVTNEMDKLGKQADILKYFTNKKINDFYYVDITGYKIIKIGLEAVDVRVTAKLYVNRYLLEAYYSAINSFSSPLNTKFCESLIIKKTSNLNTGSQTKINLHSHFDKVARTDEIPSYTFEFDKPEPRKLAYLNDDIVKYCMGEADMHLNIDERDVVSRFDVIVGSGPKRYVNKYSLYLDELVFSSTYFGSNGRTDPDVGSIVIPKDGLIIEFYMKVDAEFIKNIGSKNVTISDEKIGTLQSNDCGDVSWGRSDYCYINKYYENISNAKGDIGRSKKLRRYQ